VSYRQVQTALEWFEGFITSKSERLRASFGRFSQPKRDGGRSELRILPALLIEERLLFCCATDTRDACRERRITDDTSRSSIVGLFLAVAC